MKTLLITGDTYFIRRQIKSLGGRWNNDNKGWLVPLEKKEEAEQLQGKICVEEFEAPDDSFRQLTTEDIRAIRQDKRDRKAERLLGWAESREKEADKNLNKYKHFTSDWSFVTQPILVGHHSEKSHRSLLNKINNTIDRGYELQNEAEELKARAERLQQPVLMKGDTAKRRLAHMEFIKSQIKIGDKVNCSIFGEGIISKIFKKSYKVEGSKINRNIEFIKSINNNKL